MWLIKKGVPLIFYPSVFYERNEFPQASNHYNCPIVTSYSENIKNNVEEICRGEVKFHNPFLAFSTFEIAAKGLIAAFPDIPADEVYYAAKAGWEELDNARSDIQKKGEEVLRFLEDTGRSGIVLAGRPYHIDPEINHGIPEMINSYGLAVLTEDSISHLAEVERPTIVSDQWMYHSRLYAAATYVKTRDDIELVQLNSFGCGLDAVTTDQVNDILSSGDKIYTCLKIDEVNNLGAARIRIRSLLAAIKIRRRKGEARGIHSSAYHRVLYTRQMYDDRYTILCPQMSPIHFDLLQSAFTAEGYNLIVLNNSNRAAIDMGLQFVNNDACYPTIVSLGQIISALKSGRYDLNKTAVFMSQTGGQCRASNYVSLLRKALRDLNMEQVPVISVNMAGLETNPGFKITLPFIRRGLMSLVFGDLFMKVLYATRPYELEPGSANALYEELNAKVIKMLDPEQMKD